MADPTLFTYIDQIRLKDATHEYNPKLASPYMLLFGLSNNNADLKICNEVNRLLWNLPPDMVYKYFIESIKKGKVWAKWPKKNKDKELDKEVKLVMEKYSVSKNEARRLLEE